MHSIRIVSGRFSSRYVVRGFRFRDLNSPDLSRMVRITIFCPMLLFIIIPQNEEVILAVMATNLFQRCLEYTFVLPPNVYWGVVFAVTSNVDTEKGYCVRDGWKSVAAE